MGLWTVSPQSRSPSSRRAWIEIRCHHLTSLGAVVALLAEGVDRNYQQAQLINGVQVALLAEGVDRNSARLMLSDGPIVALLAEGVDRNRATVPAVPPLASRPPRGGRG